MDFSKKGWPLLLSSGEIDQFFFLFLCLKQGCLRNDYSIRLIMPSTLVLKNEAAEEAVPGLGILLNRDTQTFLARFWKDSQPKCGENIYT